MSRGVKKSHKQAEKGLQQLMVKALRAFGCFAYHIYSGAVPVRAIGSRIIWKPNGMDKPNGMPDLFVAHSGRVWMIEVKTGSGILSPEQKMCHADLLKAGVRVYVCRTVEEALGTINGH